MDTFIILRDAARSATRSGGLPGIGPSVFGGGLSVPVPPEPAVETAELSTAEAQDAARAPDVLAVARRMPTKLIAPVADDAAAAAATPTWGLGAVGAVDSPFTGANVTVAVLDTGIDAAHPAFAGVTLVQRDFSGDGDGDVNGHGTHCAGTIFGRDVAGQRIGVARGVTRALIGKVLGDDGSGGSDMLFNAINWAVEHEAQVISMSLGFDFPGFAVRLQEEFGFPPLLATSVALEEYRKNLRVFDALLALIRTRAAFNGGAVVCAASGNESLRQIDPNFEVSASVPAAAEGVVSVGALGESAAGLTVADFSNTNPVLSAPGVGVVSAQTGGGLVALNGTSMACPHVAGAAALWWEALRGASLPVTHLTVEARLMASAVRAPLAPDVQPADRGQGLVQVPAAAIN